MHRRVCLRAHTQERHAAREQELQHHVAILHTKLLKHAPHALPCKLSKRRDGGRVGTTTAAAGPLESDERHVRPAPAELNQGEDGGGLGAGAPPVHTIIMVITLRNKKIRQQKYVNKNAFLIHEIRQTNRDVK